MVRNFVGTRGLNGHQKTLVFRLTYARSIQKSAPRVRNVRTSITKRSLKDRCEFTAKGGTFQKNLIHSINFETDFTDKPLRREAHVQNNVVVFLRQISY